MCRLWMSLPVMLRRPEMLNRLVMRCRPVTLLDPVTLPGLMTLRPVVTEGLLMMRRSRAMTPRSPRLRRLMLTQRQLTKGKSEMTRLLATLPRSLTRRLRTSSKATPSSSSTRSASPVAR